MEKEKTLFGLKNNVIVLGVVSFFTDVSSEMIFPLLPLFLTTFLGAGKEIIGLIEGIADSITSLFDIFVGYWSDITGKRKDFVIAGYGLSSIIKIGIALSTIWQQVLVFRGLERIGKSIRTSPRDAIISESSDEKTRGKAFGLHRMMDTLGAIAGPIIAYFILSAFGSSENGYRMVFYGAIIPAVIAVAAIFFFVKEPKGAQAELKQKKPKFWDSLRAVEHDFKSFLIISCLFSLSYFSFALLIVRANEIGIDPASILILYTVYNVLYACASIPVGALSDKIGRKLIISSAFILYGLICIGFAFASDILQVGVLFALYGIFVAADDSVNKAYIADLSGKEKRAMAMGAYNTSVGAFYLPASALFGFIWAVSGAFTAFIAAAGIAILSGFLMQAFAK